MEFDDFLKDIIVHIIQEKYSPSMHCCARTGYISSLITYSRDTTEMPQLQTWNYEDVSKSSRTVLVKRSLLTLDVKFLRHLQSTPLLHEYSGPNFSAMLESIPGSPFLEFSQVPAAIPLESLQSCRIFDPSSEASAWGRGKSHRGPDRVSMGDGGSLSCCSCPKTAKV